MKIITGQVVFGDDFFGREIELNKMQEVFENKTASVLIPGPRRIGKTSLVQEFLRRNENKRKSIYIDIEKANTIYELLEDIVGKVKREHPELIDNILYLNDLIKGMFDQFDMLKLTVKIAGAVDVEVGKGKADDKLKPLMKTVEQLIEKLTEDGFIFAFDEFSDFLLNLSKGDSENNSDVKLFLSWLRSLRQEGKINMIASGSINIISTAEDLNVISLINDLTDIDILPLSKKEVSTLLANLLEDKDISLTKEAAEFSVDQLSDGIPFFVQLFASGIVDYHNSENKEYDLDAIKISYKQITNKQHIEFIDLHNRLKKYLSKEEYKAAHKILAHLSDDSMSFNDLCGYMNESMKDKSKLHKLLKRLIDECYLIKEDRLYRFVSPMLKKWWNCSYDWEK